MMQRSSLNICSDVQVNFTNEIMLSNPATMLRPFLLTILYTRQLKPFGRSLQVYFHVGKSAHAQAGAKPGWPVREAQAAVDVGSATFYPLTSSPLIRSRIPS